MVKSVRMIELDNTTITYNALNPGRTSVDGVSPTPPFNPGRSEWIRLQCMALVRHWQAWQILLYSASI